jgi:hypothetical protein
VSIRGQVVQGTFSRKWKRRQGVVVVETQTSVISQENISLAEEAELQWMDSLLSGTSLVLVV